MRRYLRITLILALVVACAIPCSATQAWRFKVSQIQPGVSDARDFDSSAKGLGVEYSMGDTFEGEDLPADASICLDYMRVNYVQFDATDATRTIRYDVKADVFSVGVNLRFGPGAKVTQNGLYAGVGAGLSFGSPTLPGPVQNFGGFGTGRNGKAFQWRAMAGMNLAGYTFGEVTYNKLGSDSVYALNVGVRL